MKEKQIRTTLHYIIQNEPNSIKAFVAKQALQRNSIRGFFDGVAKQGCVSGIICALNYYQQTHQFFDCYYEEIEKLRIDVERKTKAPIRLEYDLKTSLSWFAFEQTAYELANELRISDRNTQND